MNFTSLLYDPVFSFFSVPAILTLVTKDEPIEIPVIDRTSGVETENPSGASVVTFLPACDFKAEDLAAAGVDPRDMDNQTIAFNGKTWVIKAIGPRPSPNGAGDGYYQAILMEAC